MVHYVPTLSEIFGASGCTVLINEKEPVLRYIPSDDASYGSHFYDSVLSHDKV